MSGAQDYLSIAAYGLIGDCHSAALVSGRGSIDWGCLPRFDAGSAFGRLLDARRGGHCSISPTAPGEWMHTRQYAEDTLVLQTTLNGPSGEVRLTDCFLLPEASSAGTDRRILRMIEGLAGAVELEIRVAPRFDYGEIRPWIRRLDQRLHAAIGGNDALIVWCEEELEEEPAHELATRITVTTAQRVRLLLAYCRPEHVDVAPPSPVPEELDQALERTIARWRDWSAGLRPPGPHTARLRRSAITLKALTYAPTGAVVAAPTTSLPEAIGFGRNFDYRYAWVRDSSFSSRAFAELGAASEADAFRAFIMRSAAGHAEDLQMLYGVGGERRLAATELQGLEGYRGSAPVRSGNGAVDQRQLDSCGELINLAWRWHRRGHSPDDDDWRFLVSLVEYAAEHWREPDHGIWEWPGEPEHFVHSKAMAWAALDRGLRLADECMRRAPIRRWKKARDELRATIERRGYDRKRGVFVQVFGRSEVDAALLLLPTIEFVAWDDERMLRTIAAIREDLGAGDGLLYRYRRDDGLEGEEGAFLCCSFWLAECLARAGELQDAQAVFDHAVAKSNDLGLFSEEVDPQSGDLLGNFPQGLTHLAHIDAAVALAQERQ